MIFMILCQAKLVIARSAPDLYINNHVKLDLKDTAMCDTIETNARKKESLYDF